MSSPTHVRDTENCRTIILDDDDPTLLAATTLFQDCGWTVERPGRDPVLVGSRPEGRRPGALAIVTEIRELGPQPALDRIKRLRERHPVARIIVTTACPSVVMAVAVIRAGADDYMAKPVGSHELLSRIQENIPPQDPAMPSLAWVEWEYTQRVLVATGGNISSAARLLGVQRSTLQRRLRKYPPGR